MTVDNGVITFLHLTFLDYFNFLLNLSNNKKIQCPHFKGFSEWSLYTK